MRNRRIAVIVAQASVLFALSVLFVTIVVPVGLSQFAGAIGYLLPNAVGGWWIYRGIRSFYPRTEAIISAIAFAVCSPLALTAGTMIAEITWGGMVIAILTGTLAMMVIMFLIPATVLLLSSATAGDRDLRAVGPLSTRIHARELDAVGPALRLHAIRSQWQHISTGSPIVDSHEMHRIGARRLAGAVKHVQPSSRVKGKRHRLLQTGAVSRNGSHWPRVAARIPPWKYENVAPARICDEKFAFRADCKS